ncbi:MAG: cysteine synthase [Clostridiales bacterium]|jgi:cysteine synthase A|nr:cysteine synthase [Clostridiales bacterium]
MKSISLIGNTPVVRLSASITPDMADIYLKLEGMNLTGSVKDRSAYGMLTEAVRIGALKPGMTILEPTSGNMGISLAAIGRLMGFPVTIIMPETMTVERRRLIRAYGAELILTDGREGMTGALLQAQTLAESGQYYMPRQFTNQGNVMAHYETTGAEIVCDFEHLDAFVASVGTGGTITGTGRRLKEAFPDVEIIAVEPLESMVLSGKEPGVHKIQGIGPGFVPDILDMHLIDRIEPVSSDAAIERCLKLVEEEGLFVGISTGAAVEAALETAKRLGSGKKILAISPDRGDRYLSANIFKE